MTMNLDRERIYFIALAVILGATFSPASAPPRDNRMRRMQSQHRLYDHWVASAKPSDIYDYPESASKRGKLQAYEITP